MELDIGDLAAMAMDVDLRDLPAIAMEIARPD